LIPKKFGINPEAFRGPRFCAPVHIDGRTVSAPLAWYPRLLNATPAERATFGSGEGLHWPDLDEDVSVEGILSRRHRYRNG